MPRGVWIVAHLAAAIAQQIHVVAIATKLRHQCLRNLIAAVIRTQDNFQAGTCEALAMHLAFVTRLTCAVNVVPTINFIDAPSFQIFHKTLWNHFHKTHGK